MIVHGYNDRLGLVRVELPAAKIVEHHIDPWRLDLFDPEPVRLQLHGQWISFRRVRDLSFAYSDMKNVFIGLHDGERPICVTGTTGNQAIPWAHLSNITVSDRSFDEHLHEYLQIFIARRGGKPLTTTVMMNRAWARTIECCAFPHQAGHVKVEADRVTFEDSTRSFGIITSMYTGKMFEERAISLPLSPEINWVFDALRECKPIVCGTAIANCTRRPSKGRKGKHTRVEILVQDEHLHELKGILEIHGLRTAACTDPYTGASTTDAFTFERSGTTYLVQRKHAEPLVDRLREDGQYTAGCLYSVSANEIRGTRIAFFDCGARSARSVVNYWDLSERQRAVQHERLQQLKERGFKILKPRELVRKA